MLCFRIFLVAKKIYGKEGGGGSNDILRRNLLSQSAETFRRGTLLCCFQKIAGIEKVYRENWGGGSIESFRRNFSVSNCRNNSKGNLKLFH